MRMDQLKALAENGILGLLLAMSLIAIVYLYRQVLKEQDEKEQLLREMAQAAYSVTSSLTPLVSQLQKSVETLISLAGKKDG